MSDYIKREDAISIIRRRCKKYTTICVAAVTELQDLPPADVVEVVRCKDCKHLDKGENDSESWCECTAHFGKYFAVNEDDFCSYGERKDEGL